MERVKFGSDIHSNSENGINSEDFLKNSMNKDTSILNGPDQILPANTIATTQANGRVKLRLDKSGAGALDPISVPGMFRKIVQAYPDHQALAFKGKDNKWNYITYREYEERVRICAKSFLKLGLRRYHSVCIIGFNAPEWFISLLGAIYAGGFAAGVYTTNSADACQYCAEKSRADIIVVENEVQLDKILKIKGKLPDIKAIVQYDGIPSKEGVLSWDEFMKIGQEESDIHLNNVLKSICINECCAILYTSGTVGNPKAVMLSHDNITWTSKTMADHLGMQMGKEIIISYLPLTHIAGQMCDIYMCMAVAGTVYFADKDALKGSLLKTLLEVRPTQFLAVPRIWEKIYEKMQKIGSEANPAKKTIATWAKYHGLQYYLKKMNGTERKTFSFILARAVIFNQIKKALGLDRCVNCFSGAAPLSEDIKKYFFSIDIPLLEVYGMTECAGAHTSGSKNEINFQAIGRSRPGVATKIGNANEDNEGEVCFNGRHIFMGYLNDPEQTAECLDDEHWLHTGDAGKIDKNGYLYITGRLKELIITTGGENIPPILIEEEVKKQLPCVSNAMLIGDRRKYLTVLLTLKTEVDMATGMPLDELTQDTKDWCKEAGCAVNTVTDVLDRKNDKLMAAIQKGINEANTKAISNAQRVQKFAILPHDFSIPTGELGPTMKLKRRVVEKQYEDIIEKLYKET